MNQQYIKNLSEEEFTKHAMPYYKQAGVDGMNTSILFKCLHERVDVFTGIPGIVGFLTDLPDYNIALFTNKKSKTDPAVAASVLDLAIPALEALPSWDETSVHDLLIGMAQERGMKNGTMLWPVRIALAGQEVTPGGAIEIAMLIGREESLRRLHIGREKLHAEGY